MTAPLGKVRAARREKRRAAWLLPTLASLVVSVAVMACEAGPEALRYPLPVADAPNRCRGIGFEAIIFGDEADPRLAWLVARTGREFLLVWPPGWSARFDPKLEVLDQGGRVRLRQGDRIQGVCPKGPGALEDPGKAVMIDGL